jgi:putative Mg2+ transporter-C (MgtC) family protein
MTINAIALSDQLSIIVECALAVLLGSLIGWERDRAGKSAGPRTMALVAGASSTIVAVGEVLDFNAQYGDPTRAMHAVITGIGFLGAGLIFNATKGVQGVTTAATVFATSAMACAIGLGFHIVGIAFTVIIVAVLRSTQVLEKTVHRNDAQNS